MKYRKEIDGLRALALIPVIMFHAGFTIVSGGFVGVDIFFVISGYLITSVIIAEMEESSFSLINFYERRARRILPALFFVMLCTLLFAWFWMLPLDLKNFSKSLVAASLFVSNILFWLESGYFDNSSELKPLLHTWSLSVEEQFYVLFPLFLITIWKLGKQWVLTLLLLLAIISLIVAHISSTIHPSFTFYLLPTRIFEILIGALIALLLRNNPSVIISQNLSQTFSAVGLFTILYSIFYFDKNTPSPSLYSLYPTIGTGLIIAFTNKNTLTGKMLGSKLLVSIGLISYSAYLWHQPLLAFARLRSFDEPNHTWLGILCILSIIFGYLTWKFIETPFRKKEFLPRTSIFIYCAIGSLFFISIGLLSVYKEGFPNRLPIEANEAIFAVSDINPRQKACHFSGENFPSPQNSCVLGNTKNIQGALLGDSHADAISYGIAKKLESNNLGFLSLTYDGCPPIENIYRVDAPKSNKCYEFNKQSYKYLLENPKIQYIILSARWTLYLEKTRFNNHDGGVEDGSDVYIDTVTNGRGDLNNEFTRRTKIKNAYKSSIKKLLTAGKTVFIIYPIPEVGWNVPQRLQKQILFNELNNPITTSYEVFKVRNKESISSFNEITENIKLIRIKPDSIFCNTFVEDKCVTQVNSKILYYDDDHLSNAGARLLADEFITKLSTLIKKE